MECIERYWLCKYMKKIRNSQATIPCTELSKAFVKDSFFLRVLLKHKIALAKYFQEISFSYCLDLLLLESLKLFYCSTWDR